MNSELKKAIEQICIDKGIDKELLIDTLMEAVRTSVLRRYNDEIEVDVQYDEEKGDINVYQFKTVVPDGDVRDDNKEIEYSEALKHAPNIALEDEVGFLVNIEDLGRIAAQSAKQVIIQRLRDAEQANIFNDYKERIGEIVTGTFQRRDKAGWIVNLDRTEALLRREEQIPKEHYRRGDPVQAIIIDVHREGRGPQIELSRAHKDYMLALFRREVPEVDEGVIQVMGIAREAGSRAKVAVFSRESGIDPVGACVGVRGSRIQNIVQELRGERIDIVIWNADIATYAKNALAPALVNRIVVDEADNTLEVIVPDDQLTNAIGRKGQNVKLASRLLGWKVEILTESRYSENSSVNRSLDQVASVAEIPLRNLVSAGYATLEDLQAASDNTLKEKLGLSDARVKNLRSALTLLRPAEGKLPAADTIGDGARDDKPAKAGHE